MTFLGSHAICGTNRRYFHPASKRFPATVHGDPLHTPCFLAQVMWHRDGPRFLTDNVWVGTTFDGTKLWQASFVHFDVGDLGSQMPLGSWILLRGSEKKAIISQLAEVYDLNAEDAFRQWEKSLLATSDVVWKSGPLQLPDMKILRTELKKWGRPIRPVK